MSSAAQKNTRVFLLFFSNKKSRLLSTRTTSKRCFLSNLKTTPSKKPCAIRETKISKSSKSQSSSREFSDL